MAARRTPLERAAQRMAPVDTTGMDDEMKETLGGEQKRRAATRMITSGGEKAGQAINKGEGLVEKAKRWVKKRMGKT